MVLFLLGPTQSTFVKNDIAILSSKYELFIDNSSFGRGIIGLINLMKLSLRSIYYVLKSDAVYCWFADYATLLPSLLARILGKKVFVVAGGFDARYIPEINYGARARFFRWFCVKNTFRLATLVFPVSKATEVSLHNLTQGKHGITKVIYNGLNVSQFMSQIKEIYQSKRNIILTISQADTELEMRLKGIDRFISIAGNMPVRRFVVAGLKGAALNQAEKLAANFNNIEIIPGPLNLYDDLIPLYLDASAYCQLSLDDTFGLAVVESMLCGAMPIITPVGGLPEVVGKKKYSAKKDDKIIKLINKSFEISDEERFKIARFARKFDLKNRKRILLSCIEESFNSSAYEDENSKNIGTDIDI